MLLPKEKKFVLYIFLRMNELKMPYFANDGFKRDFAELIFTDASSLVKSKFGKHLI